MIKTTIHGGIMADSDWLGMVKLAFGSPGMAAGMQAAKLPGAGGPVPVPPTPKIPATYKPGPSSQPPSVAGEFLRGARQGFGNAANALYGAGMGAAATPLKLHGQYVMEPLARASDAVGLTNHATPAAQEYTKIMSQVRDAGMHDAVRPFIPSSYAQPPATLQHSQQMQQNMRTNGNDWMASLTGGADTVGRTATGMAMGLGALQGVGGVAAGAISRVAGMFSKIPGATNMMKTVAPVLGNPYVHDLVTQPLVNRVAGVYDDGTPVVPASPSGVYSNALSAARKSGMLPSDNPQAPVSPITQSPEYESVAQFAASNQEAAQQIATHAATQVGRQLDTPEGATELQSIQANGQLTPNGQRGALTALTNQGYDFQQASATLAKMDPWEQLGLWGGLSVAGLGLLHAMSGGGGVGSLLMSLLGLGAAGFTAGKNGLLDQGSKELATGISDAAKGFMGGEGAGMQVPDSMKGMSAGMFDAMPDAAVVPMMRSFAQTSPEIAAKLDQAAGVGGWGNKLLSYAGGDYAQNQLQQALGLNPAQSQRLLKLWADSRQ